MQEDWPRHAVEVVSRALPTAVPANLTGVPALSLPMGLDEDGLPAGMQFFAPSFEEKRLPAAGLSWEGTGRISHEKAQGAQYRAAVLCPVRSMTGP